jgi:hypothetical protein
LFYEENIYQNMEEISDNEIQTSSWNISVASASFLYIPRTILQGKQIVINPKLAVKRVGKHTQVTQECTDKNITQAREGMG